MTVSWTKRRKATENDDDDASGMYAEIDDDDAASEYLRLSPLPFQEFETFEGKKKINTYSDNVCNQTTVAKEHIYLNSVDEGIYLTPKN